MWSPELAILAHFHHKVLNLIGFGYPELVKSPKINFVNQNIPSSLLYDKFKISAHILPFLIFTSMSSPDKYSDIGITSLPCSFCLSLYHSR